MAVVICGPIALLFIRGQPLVRRSSDRTLPVAGFSSPASRPRRRSVFVQHDTHLSRCSRRHRSACGDRLSRRSRSAMAQPFSWRDWRVNLLATVDSSSRAGVSVIMRWGRYAPLRRRTAFIKRKAPRPRPAHGNPWFVTLARGTSRDKRTDERHWRSASEPSALWSRVGARGLGTAFGASMRAVKMSFELTRSGPRPEPVYRGKTAS